MIKSIAMTALFSFVLSLPVFAQDKLEQKVSEARKKCTSKIEVSSEHSQQGQVCKTVKCFVGEGQVVGKGEKARYIAPALAVQEICVDDDPSKAGTPPKTEHSKESPTQSGLTVDQEKSLKTAIDDFCSSHIKGEYTVMTLEDVVEEKDKICKKISCTENQGSKIKDKKGTRILPGPLFVSRVCIEKESNGDDSTKSHDSSDRAPSKDQNPPPPAPGQRNGSEAKKH